MPYQHRPPVNTTRKPCNSIFPRPYDLTRHEDTIHNGRKIEVSDATSVLGGKTFRRNDGRRYSSRIQVVIVISRLLWTVPNTTAVDQRSTTSILFHCAIAAQPHLMMSYVTKRKRIYLSVPTRLQQIQEEQAHGLQPQA